MTVAPMTMPAVLQRNREAHGPKRVIVTADRSITHAELDGESRALAARLAAAGVGKGARVGLLMPNGIEWAVIAAAVWRTGGVLVPLSTLLRPPELAAQLQVAGVTHLVLARAFRGRSYLDDVDAIAPGVATSTAAGRRHPTLPFLRHVWLVDDLPRAAVDDALVSALGDVIRPADDLVVLFTSGSRGAPKGVVHTHGSALRAVGSSLDARRVGADDRLYIPMPFFWTGGLAAGLLTVLVAGATLLTEAIPEPESTLELLERERATLFRGWPDQAARLASDPRFATADLSSLGPGSLAAVLPPAQRPAAGARANLFGMTETFGPYCAPARSRPARTQARQLRAALRRSRGPRGARGVGSDGRARRDRRDPASRAQRHARRSAAGPATPCSTAMGGTRRRISARSIPTATSGSTDASTTCSRSAARPCTPRRSRPRCAASTVCNRRMSPTCRAMATATRSAPLSCRVHHSRD